MLKKVFSFTREHTEMIKGVAILLMLVHHLFFFPEWYVEGVSYIGIPLRVNTVEYVIGSFGHICVSIFAFITGYGMYFSYRSGGILKKSLSKGVSFLVCYWLVMFAVAIPVNLLLGKTDITLGLIAKNLFAYENSLVSFAWYVRFYLEMLITLPLFYFLLSKRAVVTVPLFMIIPVVINHFLGKVPGTSTLVCKVVYYSMEYFLWITTGLLGLCVARYGIFEKMGRLLSRMGRADFAFCVALMLVLVYLRAYKENAIGYTFTFDCIYAPIFVFLAVNIIDKLPILIHRFLKLMGKYSMFIWFLHSLFFFRTSDLMKYLYAPKVSILILMWAILLCLPVAWLLTKISDFILMKVDRKSSR